MGRAIGMLRRDAALGGSHGTCQGDAPVGCSPGRLWWDAPLGCSLGSWHKAGCKPPAQPQQAFPFPPSMMGSKAEFCLLPAAVSGMQISGQKKKPAQPNPTKKPPRRFFVLFAFSVFQVVLQDIQNFTLYCNRLVQLEIQDEKEWQCLFCLNAHK